MKTGSETFVLSVTVEASETLTVLIRRTLTVSVTVEESKMIGLIGTCTIRFSVIFVVSDVPTKSLSVTRATISVTVVLSVVEIRFCNRREKESVTVEESLVTSAKNGNKIVKFSETVEDSNTETKLRTSIESDSVTLEVSKTFT